MGVRKDEVNLFACFVFLTPRKILAGACQKFLHPTKNPIAYYGLNLEKAKSTQPKRKDLLLGHLRVRLFPLPTKRKKNRKRKAELGRRKKGGKPMAAADL